jgi:hypothetical protein
MTTKPNATKGQSSKWGKGAGKASALTWGDLLPGWEKKTVTLVAKSG